ncbi:MAG: glycoside hydrolase family 127 protein [Verrucomicrobia bacterium]|nr:glycoside hydrolase family 127 protein [Verrucomicrobiota bacterium]MCG2680856.1 glycoside hydrolase family 127 protein [Kiritimatiellia bacterium]MBU4246866.1 glycoside hydrolase family 127 protein [Verrucomicrobiota bacterium]MBU4290388.1 glycoside hydrolase family 127 protein [Verrucomicrobiota bacterium]MBU4430239.1 glycoside hydrolase family 127 protein [Verrucomicrobiota bacterium]
MKIQTMNCPGRGQSNAHYRGNRPPLLPNPLIKLPLGSVRPRGWLKHQLDLMVEGMTGRLPEVSPFLKADNGWFGGEKEGWEEQPYWFRGFYDLSVLTGDARCREIANHWINAVLGSQDSDGYFGARFHKAVTGKNGQNVCDLWPHMVMLDAVIHHAECSDDARVLPFLQRFFAFCRDLPNDRFLSAKPDYDIGNTQHCRAGDMLPHIYWLYNRTEERWLLDLARRFYDRISSPPSEWLDHHVVHFTQRFQYPGVYYALSHDRRHLELTEYWYAQHLNTWGQQPRGIFGADELIRPGKVDPRQGFETCGITEFAKSFYLLGQISGDPVYADRCEDIMLNHFPAAQTPDLKALHYLTAANMPQLDRNDHDFQNKGWMLPYSPHIYRCCQHNVAMGWPWYLQNLWQATGDNGLAAWMYGASEVTAKAGREGDEITIQESTDYPFRTGVKLTIQCARSVEFPLYLRVPRWCEGFSVAINGTPSTFDSVPGSWVRIENTWRNADTVELVMPVKLSLTEWPRTGSVTVDRGPLSYSVRIEEDWQRADGTDEWPGWEVFPKSPWNYGLVSDQDQPTANWEVKEKSISPTQPWTLDAAPIEITVKAKRIPGWRIEENTVQPLQESPIKSDQPEETITMIPLGCARLRVSCLPRIGAGPDAHAWK